MTFDAYGNLLKSVGSLLVKPFTSAADQVHILKPETGPGPVPVPSLEPVSSTNKQNLLSRLNLKLPSREDMTLFFKNIGSACQKAWSDVKYNLKVIQIEGHKNFLRSKVEVIENVVRHGYQIRSIPFIFAKNTSGKYQLLYIRTENPKKVHKIGIAILPEGYKVIDANGRNIMGEKIYPTVKALAADFEAIINKIELKKESTQKIIKGRKYEGLTIQDFEKSNHFTLLVPGAPSFKIEYMKEDNLYRILSVNGNADVYKGNKIPYLTPYQNIESLYKEFLGEVKTIEGMENHAGWQNTVSPSPSTVLQRTLKNQPGGLYILSRGKKEHEIVLTYTLKGSVKEEVIPFNPDGTIKGFEDKSYTNIDDYLMDKLPLYKPYSPEKG